MKRTKILSLIGAGALALVAIPSGAQPISLNTVYSSVLPSVFTPGLNAVTINWEVSTTQFPGFYTYEYQVVNSAGARPGAANLDFFSITFDTTKPGAVVAGDYSTLKPTGVDWKFAGLALGGSTAALGTPLMLFFTSLDAPTWGSADASDAIPPSPFVSGDRVAVPNVPDGGLTVALLGFALVGVESLRRKLKK